MTVNNVKRKSNFNRINSLDKTQKGGDSWGTFFKESDYKNADDAIKDLASIKLKNIIPIIIKLTDKTGESIFTTHRRTNKILESFKKFMIKVSNGTVTGTNAEISDKIFRLEIKKIKYKIRILAAMSYLYARNYGIDTNARDKFIEDIKKARDEKLDKKKRNKDIISAIISLINTQLIKEFATAMPTLAPVSPGVNEDTLVGIMYSRLKYVQIAEIKNKKLSSDLNIASKTAQLNINTKLLNSNNKKKQLNIKLKNIENLKTFRTNYYTQLDTLNNTIGTTPFNVATAITNLQAIETIETNTNAQLDTSDKAVSDFITLIQTTYKDKRITILKKLNDLNGLTTTTPNNQIEYLFKYFDNNFINTLTLDKFNSLLINTNTNANALIRELIDAAKLKILVSSSDTFSAIAKLIINAGSANAANSVAFINAVVGATPLSNVGSANPLVLVKAIITELHNNIAVDAAFANAIIQALTVPAFTNIANFANSNIDLGKEVGKLMIKSGNANAANSIAFITAVAPGAVAAANATQAFITGIFDAITTIGNHTGGEANCATFADAFLQQHATLATAAILAVPNINQSFAKLIYAAGANLAQRAFVKYAAIAAILRTEAVPAGGVAATAGSIQAKIIAAPYNVPNDVALTYKQAPGAPAAAAAAAATAFAQYTVTVPVVVANNHQSTAGAAVAEDVVRLINAIKHAGGGAKAGADALFTALYGAAAVDPTAGGNLPAAAALPFVFPNWAQIQAFMGTATGLAAAVADSIVNHIVTTDDPFQAGGSKNRSYRIRKLKKSKNNNKKSKKYHSRKQNHMQNNKLNNKPHSIQNKSTKHHKTKRH